MAARVEDPNQMSCNESRHTGGLIAGVLGLGLGLFSWYVVFRLTDDRYRDGLGILTILSLLSSAIAILTITQLERLAERGGFRLLSLMSWPCLIYLVLCPITIVASRFGPSQERGWVLRVLVCLGVLVALVGILAAPRTDVGPQTVVRSKDSEVDQDADPKSTSHPIAEVAAAATDPAAAAKSRTKRHTGTDEPASDPDPAKTFTLALSGGGIRATSFGLGAYQALACRRESLGTREPRVVAVSGGSYIAGAIGLLRAYKRVPPKESTCWDKPLKWHTAYEADSSELRRLRRHTRDLVEPGRALLSGGLTLIAGALLNLFIILGLLLGAAAVLAWLYRTSALAEWSDIFRDHPRLWHSPQAWAVGVPLILLTLAWLVFSFHVMSLSQRRDSRGATGNDHLSPARSRRSNAFIALVLWVTVMLAVPATLRGLNNSSLSNEPSPLIAGLVSGLGFTTPGQCDTAAKANLAVALAKATEQARLSPGTPITTTNGACGETWSITITEPPPDNAPQGSVRSVVEAGGDKPGLSAIIAQLSAVIALLGTLGFSFSRGISGQGSPATRMARVRRFLVSWVPLTAGSFLAVWLLLLWTFDLTMSPALLAHSWWLALFPLAALGISTFFDANATSLHSHYRDRLHSAFAVAHDDEGTADRLPVEKAHGFSGLGTVDVRVVTTANVRAYDETPTRRGGLPFVFSPSGPRLVASSGTYTEEAGQYEEAAGPGRVSVMAAVAASGAAVSPLAGRFAATIAPYRVLLTVFNVRVGQWVPNPRWTRPPPDGLRTFWTILGEWPYRPWLIARPGAAQVFSEAFGQSSSADRWLYLSDGGHLDNTGLVEAVRMHDDGSGHFAGRVLVIDASNDAAGSWAAVGDALAVARADLHVDFECVLEDQAGVEPARLESRTRASLHRFVGAPDAEEPARTGCHRLFRGTGDNKCLEVMVVKAVRPADLNDLPQSLRSFAAVRPDFPRAPTTRQDFGDLEFEAYRQLGELYTARALSCWLKE